MSVRTLRLFMAGVFFPVTKEIRWLCWNTSRRSYMNWLRKDCRTHRVKVGDRYHSNVDASSTLLSLDHIKTYLKQMDSVGCYYFLGIHNWDSGGWTRPPTTCLCAQGGTWSTLWDQLPSVECESLLHHLDHPDTPLGCNVCVTGQICCCWSWKYQLCKEFGFTLVDGEVFI